MSANKNQVSSLDDYRSRRRPGRTPEPFGTDRPEASRHVFVVQKHKARRLHFDLRLEWRGALLSWAVPKGFSLDPSEKRLAVQTEPHPLEYADFEAVIPPGNYGAGAMIVWDRGTWIPLEDPDAGLEKGKLLFELKGYKLHGVWTLVKTRKDNEWLLIKKPDGWAREGAEAERFAEESILSGLTVEELAEGSEKARLLVQEVTESAPPFKGSYSDLEFMLARTAEPFSRKGWIFELKYDGYRMMACRTGPRVQLRYRKGSDVTFLYPELTRALVALPFEDFVLDGELVALDESGRPSFQRLQGRAQKTTGVDAEAQALETPVTLFAFDLLVLSGRDLRALSLDQRKAFLKRMLPSRGPIRYADHVEEAGRELFEQVQQQRLEGIIAKRASSVYRAGRSGSWLKMPADRISDFVVVGYTRPKGGRKGFGALHLAALKKRGILTYAGRVGTGFTDQFLREFVQDLKAIRIGQPPCEGAVPPGREHVWVEPHYVARVRFKKRTADNLLRQPSFLGLAADLTPEMLDSETPEEEPNADVESEPSAGDAVEGPKFSITNPDKVFWPEDNITKGDLIEYYRSISDWILPYLQGRPVVLDRYPDGIYGKSFFQKNVPDYVPAWMRTAQIWEEGDIRGSNLFLCDDLDSLVYLANLGTIPLHIWSSRVESIRHPDWCVIDLDPKDAPFRDVVRIARRLRDLCLELEIEPFLKTTGGSGLHLLLPLGAAYTHGQSKLLAELLARIVSADLPEIATLERTVERRESKVYIDCYQNGQGKLIVAPFSVRPYPRAPVSTPLQWEELTEEMDVRDFNLHSVPERMQALKYDPLRNILERDTDLTRVIERLSRGA